MPEEMDLEEKENEDTEMEDEEDTEEFEEAEEEQGSSHDDEDDEEKDAKKHHKHKRWYASAWFWAIVVAVLVLIGALIWFFGFYEPQKSSKAEATAAEKATNSDWSDVVKKTDTFAEQVGGINNVDDFNSLSKDAEVVLEVVSRSEDRYKNQSTLQDTKYQNALEAINSYVLSLQALLEKDYTKITSNDFDSVKNLASEAKTAADSFENGADYVKDSVGNDFFNASIKVKSVYDAKIAEDQAASEAEKAAQQKEAERLAQEQEDVNAAVTGFTTQYIKKNKMEINKYMTDNFQNEFDYDKLSSAYYEATNYRIIDTVKNSDTRYYVYGRLTEKQIGGSDQYAYDYNFTVVLDGSSWRVDVDSAPAR